ncbi:unnamed protein product [Brassica oleracea var. botrytis]|uniref:FBD domain-containing protein n=1 Tax=Brassica oleracea TaxID=3712 RepID=A0A3P6C863_BRAOL|nr:unnamed protein product [Brassica oleracea]
MVELGGHLGCLFQISPKCSKIITYLQITPDLINIINRLYNIIIISKNTYKPWIKVDQIHGILLDLKRVPVVNWKTKLKTLNLESFMFEKDEIGFAKLLSGCPNDWDSCYVSSCYVSSKTLKRLMPCSSSAGENPKRVSFDTPNVVYFEYSDNIAYKYPVLNFDSLVEAHIDIKMTYNQKHYFTHGLDSNEEAEIFSDPKVLLMGICNVKTLYISYRTLETLNFFCEAIPVFDSFPHLTIDSHTSLVGWKSLPELLQNSPNLETLVFKGLNSITTLQMNVGYQDDLRSLTK